MRGFSTIAIASTLAVSVSASTNYLGFNSGATKQDDSVKTKDDFKSEFTAAQKLQGAPGIFNAIRLYTNIQGSTTNDPIEAFEAAIDTNTSLLLGVWASGTDSITNELSALQKAVSSLGSAFTDLVIGISIGSEDLYRNSVTGMKNQAGVGSQPDTILGFIDDYKKAVAGTGLASVPIGHVDTWDAWTNTTNQKVMDAVDWIGVDEYPYYQTGYGNNINNSVSLFSDAYEKVIAVAGNKSIWITETGWPYQGPNWDEAVPSTSNAQFYWESVGCQFLFNKVPVFWYTMEDNSADKAQFSISDNLSTTPRWNLTCPSTYSNTTTSAASSTTSATSAASALQVELAIFQAVGAFVIGMIALL